MKSFKELFDDAEKTPEYWMEAYELEKYAHTNTKRLLDMAIGALSTCAHCARCTQQVRNEAKAVIKEWKETR